MGNARGTGGDGDRGVSLGRQGLASSSSLAGWCRFFVVFLFLRATPRGANGLMNCFPRRRRGKAEAMIMKPSISSQSSHGLTTFCRLPTTANLEPGVRPIRVRNVHVRACVTCASSTRVANGRQIFCTPVEAPGGATNCTPKTWVTQLFADQRLRRVHAVSSKVGSPNF